MAHDESRPDDIRRLSDELARDPSSRVFMELGERLRRLGQTDVALKVVLRGLERHPYDADAHDLLARIAIDRGEMQRAHDEWDATLRLSPRHVGARKGLGFLHFQQGQYREAGRYLSEAAIADPGDRSIAAALKLVEQAQVASPAPPAPAHPAQPRSSGGTRRDSLAAALRRHSPPPRSSVVAVPAQAESNPLAAGPSSTTSIGRSTIAQAHPEQTADAPKDAAARENDAHAETRPPARTPRGTVIGALGAQSLFQEFLGDKDQSALLLDAEGFVLAGAYRTESGRDVSQEVGAQLSGVSDEAARAMRHLELGEWNAIVFESSTHIIGMAPAPDGGLVMVATSKSTPLGLVRRLLARIVDRARSWLGGDAE
jgi:tetratricopeptide (TPR) repeat protein